MIALIKRLHRQIKRARHAREALPRLDALRPDVERACGGPVSFAPTEGGGHDYVFYVSHDDRRIAVLRLANTPCISAAATAANGPINIGDPHGNLSPRERIAREYRICQKGGELGITPRPLWLSDDGTALMNTFVDGQRLQSLVLHGNIGFWDAIDRAADRAAQFHAAIGEAHMDLSLMNVIADEQANRLVLIDFELAPSPALSRDETFLFDFLNLVEMAYKFMSPADRKEASERLDPFLSRYTASCRAADVSKMATKLSRVLGDPSYRGILARHFPLTPITTPRLPNSGL